MPILKDILPDEVRAKIYFWFALGGLVLFSAQVGFVAAQAEQPVALTVALAVYTFVGGAFGFTAQANTPAGRYRADV